MSSITIMHDGKRYEVEDFKIVSPFNGCVKIKFNDGICPECGGSTFWIAVREAKPVTRDGSAKEGGAK